MGLVAAPPRPPAPPAPARPPHRRRRSGADQAPDRPRRPHQRIRASCVKDQVKDQGRVLEPHKEFTLSEHDGTTTLAYIGQMGTDVGPAGRGGPVRWRPPGKPRSGTRSPASPRRRSAAYTEPRPRDRNVARPVRARGGWTIRRGGQGPVGRPTQAPSGRAARVDSCAGIWSPRLPPRVTPRS